MSLSIVHPPQFLVVQANVFLKDEARLEMHDMQDYTEE